MYDKIGTIKRTPGGQNIYLPTQSMALLPPNRNPNPKVNAIRITTNILAFF